MGKVLCCKQMQTTIIFNSGLRLLRAVYVLVFTLAQGTAADAGVFSSVATLVSSFFRAALISSTTNMLTQREK